ncbi:MAG: 30S ribosomal protein S8e [Candidatus Aenigmatarchaeota archaeon]
MAKWNLRSNRKPTGGKLNRLGKKVKRNRRREPLLTKLGEPAKKVYRSLGGFLNIILLSDNQANVTDPATGKTKKVKILTVVENPANPHFVRRNVITKGATINTELGKAKVTSRPTKSGMVNAVLVKQ